MPSPSILRMRAMVSTTFTVGAPSASRLSDENRDSSCGPGLVLLVWRKRRDGKLPQPHPLDLVIDLANPHRLHRGVVADLDSGVGAQVVYPDRGCRRSSHRADEDVVGAILHAHQRGLANRAGLVAGVRHDDHRQPGITERGAFGAAAAFVELDLISHPLPGTG